MASTLIGQSLYFGVNLKLPTKEPINLSFKRMTVTAIAEYISRCRPFINKPWRPKEK